MAFTPEELEGMTKAAVDAAKAAGRSLKKMMNNIHVKRKKDGTLVTNLDIAADQIILSNLQNAFPQYGYLSEESGVFGSRDARWIIDPVDGSDLLSRGIPLWSIMIAFELQKQVVLGIIYNPILGHLFVARKGCGAYLNGKKIQVSRTDTLKNSFLCHSGQERLSYSRRWKGFRSLLRKVGFERGIGDYWGWMLIAIGKADIGFHHWLGPEDMAAAKIIIEEAGGVMTDLDGINSIYNGHALVSNGLLHQQALKIIKA